MIAETLAPGASVSKVAQRYGVNANLLFTWRRPRQGADGDRAGVGVSMDGPRDARVSSSSWQMLGCSYLFGLWRNIVADLDEIRGLAPNYVGGLSEPDRSSGLASSGPTGLPSSLRLPSHSRTLDALHAIRQLLDSLVLST